ncbi:MAG: hypothetical protein KBC91_05125 [Candidatus Omnitrophica bacterium]|nr:hypothetical protein [Candidatus Omnitrophota bacterium]
MMFEILLTPSAKETLDRLEKDATKAGLLKQVRKTLGFLQTNLRHPSLNTHEYQTIASPFSKDEKVFEAYAQNKTPGAYRVFWCYGPNKKQISIIAITPHP